MRSPTPINILLVEDDPADVELTRRGLGRGKVQNRLWVVGDGLDALAFLRREGPQHRVARPHLLVLAVDLPPPGRRGLLPPLHAAPPWRGVPVGSLPRGARGHGAPGRP